MKPKSDQLLIRLCDEAMTDAVGAYGEALVRRAEIRLNEVSDKAKTWRSGYRILRRKRREARSAQIAFEIYGRIYRSLRRHYGREKL